MARPNPWTMIAEGGASTIDAGELRRALGYLVSPDECHEVRALPSGRSRLIRGDDLDAAIRAIESLADGSGVYLTANPVRPDLGDGAAKNADIARRRNFYIDIDPVRPKGTNATDDEHEAARQVAESVMADLSDRGWPSPVVVDSGSGWHLHYAIDLPNDKPSQSLVSRALKSLPARHDTDAVKVDPAVHNAARIVRLPGTWNRKGPNTAERPHRPCRIVSVPVAIATANAEQIKALAGGEARREHEGTRDAPPRPPSDHWKKQADDGAIAYARSAMEREVGKVATVPPGVARNTQLHESALKLGGFIASGLLRESEVVDTLTRAGRAIGLGTDGDPHEIERAITNGMTEGMKTPKYGPEKPARGPGSHKPSGATVDAETGKRTYPFPLIVRASDVQAKVVDWLWPGRIPIGFLTLLAGRTSVGKSFVTLDFVSRLTAGEELPDRPGGECLDPENVLIISEDSMEYVLIPRLKELGADRDRVSIMTFEAMAKFDLSNIDMLDDLYEQAGAPRLVVIDPPTNFLGQKDEHRNAEVRGVLMGISIWSMKHDLAVVMITHCNKGIKKDMSALDRIIGSVAWASTSRLAHILAPDPDEPDRCLFIPMKNNIGELAKGLAYRVRKTERCAVVDWLGPVDMSGDQALYGEAKPRKVVAGEWLIERFRERLEWPSEDLFRAAKENGVSRDAIFEAKRTIGLPTARVHVGEDGSRHYVWWVPPDFPLLRKDAP